MALVIARYLRVLKKKILMEDWLCTTLKELRLKDTWWKVYLDIPFFFTAPSVFVGFKNVSALGNKNFAIKGMIQRWPVIHSQFALQSWSYYECYEFEAKVQVKTIEKKLHFLSMLIAFTPGFEKDSLKSGAQTLDPQTKSGAQNLCSSADHAVISVPDSRCSVPPSPFPVLHSPTTTLQLWCNSSQFKQQFPKTS